MEEVFFFFKIIEAVLGTCCMVFHIQGFLNDQEPFPHQMYFCGTFFGFTIIAVFGIAGIRMGSKPYVLMEAVLNAFAFVFFLISSIFSMYHAERDFHLMYLSDHEEALHPFFALSKKQSITALVCALFYLLHATFAVDSIVITEEYFEVQTANADIMKADLDCYRPIKLYLFGKTVHEWLNQQIWFRIVVGQAYEDLTRKVEVRREVKYVKKTNIL